MIYRAGEHIPPSQVRAVTFGSRRRGLDPDTVIGHWSYASDQLGLLTESLTGAVSALTSCTGRQTGATS